MPIALDLIEVFSSHLAMQKHFCFGRCQYSNANILTGKVAEEAIPNLDDSRELFQADDCECEGL